MTRHAGIAAGAISSRPCLYSLGTLIYGLVNPQELWSWPEPSHFQTRRAQIVEDLEAGIDGAKVVWARGMPPARNRELLEYFEDRRAWFFYPDDPEARLQPHRRG